MVGDSAAMAGSLMALDYSLRQLFGNGVLAGMGVSAGSVAGTVNVAAGAVLSGHVLVEPGSAVSVAGSANTGTLYLYAAPASVAYTSIGTVTAGAPAASGADAPAYFTSPTLSTRTDAVLLATVTLSAGTVVSVADKRTILPTPAQMTSTITRLCTKETTVYGALSAPLPSPVLFACPTALNITSLGLYVQTPPTGQAIIARVQRSGVDVWLSAHYPSIAPGASAGGSATSPDGAYNCVAGTIVSVDLTQAGSTTPGSNLIVVLGYSLA